ncbi:neuromedin-U receptor 2 [Biomphalaria pfeifferi]|uniref:Neuromedin-U receptor 2 n=1 Tax=Biomphalaria pfeifferi TaxID=112525 RepID=A0AAD8B386_BIOPF|nr:neuromedin-U receptor 2 [Biomphalaria pfeifferi]
MELARINITIFINESKGESESRSDDEFDRVVNTARYAINFVVTPILCIFGVVGNILNVIVLRRCGYKDTNVLLLESLSVADLILSVVHSFVHVHFIIECFDFVVASVFGTFSFVYLFGAYQTSLSVVELHLVGIAFERVIAVYFPFHVSRIFLRSRVLMYIIAMYLFAIVYNAPQFFVFESGWMNVSSLNRTIAVIVPTQFYLSNLEVMLNYLILGISALNTGIFPITTIFACFIVGVKLLWRKKQNLISTKRKDKNDLKGMKLLIAVCIISVLFCVSGLTLNYYFYTVSIFVGSFHELLIDVTNLISQFFSSSNFFIYVTMSRKFYRAYRKLICRF